MIKRYFGRWLYYAVIITVILPARPVVAAAPVPDALRSLFAHAAQPAGSGLFVDHAAYLLIRRGDQVRATALGDFARTAAWPAGVEVVRSFPGLVDAWCTEEGLNALALDPATRAIVPPLRFRTAQAESEALAVMDVAPFLATGATGSGVRVAVIDVDFSGYESLLGAELPPHVETRSFVDPDLEPFRERSYHGTAVAEIIHDVAPGADLIFLTILTQSDFFEAVTWCIENEVSVVNMSLGFVAGPRDGSSTISAEVDRASQAGIVWINSAGNEAASHWGGDWVDADADSYLDFAPGLEVVGFTYPGFQGGGSPAVVAQLIWDRWPTTTGLSLELEIYRDSLRAQLATSSNGQPSGALPYRVATLNNAVAGTRYYLAIKRQSGVISSPLRLDVFNDETVSDMQPRNAGGSLLIPADARGALSVGAYDFTKVTPGADPVRFYSSRGPTWDGRSKPEIVAADGVSTTTYGPRGFYGTSASAPHVAGAAALLSSASVRGGLFTYVWNREDLLKLLAIRPLDFGPPGNDDTYGLGGIVLPPASSRPADLSVTAFPNPFNANLVISFRAEAGQSYIVRIFALLGRQVWSAREIQSAAAAGDARITWSGRDAGGHDLGSGVYFFSITTADGRVQSGRALLLK